MTKRSHRRPPPARWTLVLLLLPGAAAAQPPTAGEAYSNLQVLRDVPALQLVPAMEFVSASLGVACDYCHVPGAFEEDAKAPKEAARGMMRMMRAINAEHFEGRRVITCYSCHRGSTEPAVEPRAGPPWQLVEAPAAETLSPDEVFASYLRAIGGAEALSAVTSRAGKGTVTAFGDRRFPFEISQVSPLKSSTAMQLPGGSTVSTFDGTAGTVVTPNRPPRVMTGSEIAAAVVANDFYWALHPGEVFAGSRVAGRATIDDRDMVVVQARVLDHPVELAFDVETGRLRRMLSWTETPLGRLPTQVDYVDYREVDGIVTAFGWTVERPQGRFGVELTEVEHDIAIDGSR